MSHKLVLVAFVAILLGPVAQLAGSPYDRVAYFDDNYATHWIPIGEVEQVRDALQAAGYAIVDADELKDWMDARIADGKLSVVVFCQDVAPETVVETNDETCTLRQYLNAGGKVVFYGDIPFYNQGNPGGGETNWGGNGSVGILGFNASPSGGWDANAEVTITEAGATWGLTEPWVSVRPADPTLWENMTILALDENGNAPAYVAHYVSGDTYRGFVRIWDRGSIASIEDLIRIAEYAENVEMATVPVPDEGTVDVMRDVVLSWNSGSTAVTHDVYFGTSFADVNDASRDNPLGVLVSENQSANKYDPDGLLEFGTTYYWRIDEVNGAPGFEIFKGAIWSFTAEPLAYPIANVTATSNDAYEAGAGPENTINGSGLNELDQHSTASGDMFVATPADGTVSIQYEFDQVYKLHELLVWNYNVQFEKILGFGFKDVTVEYSMDGVDWMVLGDVTLAQATANATYEANSTVAFDGVAAQYVRLTANTGYGTMGQYGLSEVRFTYIPAAAREPEPADGDSDVSVSTVLSWRGGRDAVSHDVSIGTEAAALPAPASVDATSYDPGPLDLATTYYWQITAVQDAESWQGPLWSFATQEYLVIDDFESYNDEDNLIYETWIDGWTNDTGSTVGYLEEPFAERTTVHGGSQSMPLQYDNTDFTTSEADLELNQNWATNGIRSLALYFHGNSANSGGQLYVKINNTKIAYDGDAAALGIAGWHKWSIVLADTGVNLNNVTTLTVGVEGAGAQGTLYIDDIRLSPQVPAPHTSDIGIAISAQANWWSQEAANREMEEIVDNTQAPAVVFDTGSQDGLAAWLSDHTNNGVANLLILCGQLPDTIYEPGNVQADDSIVEQFLDAGNTIINTGDWIFYVVNSAGTNGAAGLQTIMDIPGVTVAGGDNTAVTVTAEGQEFTPSLQDFATDRPFHLDTLEGDWTAELILAQDAGGTLADPVIVRNSATGGRIGIFHQAASEDNLPRGEVISEWINNWYLDAAGGN